MSTRNENLQQLWHRFVIAHGGNPASPRAVVKWAMDQGLLEEPKLDPIQVLATEMARALREEYKTDSRGRRYRVNHSAKITANGIQTSMWAELETAPYYHMVRAFADRRRQIVGDCLQLKIDVDVYNENHKAPDKDAIQLELNFTEDIDELQLVSAPEAA